LTHNIRGFFIILGGKTLFYAYFGLMKVFLVIPIFQKIYTLPGNYPKIGFNHRSFIEPFVVVEGTNTLAQHNTPLKNSITVVLGDLCLLVQVVKTGFENHHISSACGS